MTSWSPQQSEALLKVAAWLREPRGKQVFRVFGYAGTGKTTMAKEIAGMVGGKVMYGAFTGKAALVLQTKGCVGASTIHSMIYVPDDMDSEIPTFKLNPLSAVKDARLVIIDECSMVNEELGQDLLSFGTRVLVLGDPAQLPPVNGEGFFTAQQPDVMLTEVHRQALDNPIIRMSMDIRAGARLRHGDYGESRVLTRAELTTEDATGADMLLVGMNRTRRQFNTRLRELDGVTDEYPVLDDKLVCLRNNSEKGLLNGGIWRVIDLPATKSKKLVVKLHLAPEDAGMTARHAEVLVHRYCFLGRQKEVPWAMMRGLDEFDYGRALTVHKSQGSQWDNVLLFDESGVFREDRSRWLYTGITRAAKRVTVVM